ncbi:MAG: NUDIX domain-containing protein, partial [Leptospirales bacterium]
MTTGDTGRGPGDGSGETTKAAPGPVVGVGALVIKDGGVLLIQRGRFPGVGQWAIPGGKQAFGETLQQTAEREILEETGVRIEAGEPVYCFEALFDEQGEEWIPGNAGPPAHHYVVIDLEAIFLSGEATAGDDATDA